MQHFSALDYLKIDIANNFGKDKLSWQERLAWFNENANKYGDDFRLNMTHMFHLSTEADNESLYLAGLDVYCRYIQHPEIPVEYYVSLDCTSSVIQWMSILSGDINGAEMSNVIDTGKRRDAYTEIYNSMRNNPAFTAGLTRSDIKNAIMTYFYGSKAVPKKVFGSDKAFDAFEKSLANILPNCVSLRDKLLSTWQSDTLTHEWVMPDDFHVRTYVKVTKEEDCIFKGKWLPKPIKYTVNEAKDYGVANAANTVHSIDGMAVREMLCRCMLPMEKKESLNKILYSSKTKSQLKYEINEDSKLLEILIKHYIRCGFLSSRIFQYITEDSVGILNKYNVLNKAQKLFATIPQKSFPIYTVHDCFFAHPNNMNIVREQFSNIMNEVARSSILLYIIGQITHEKDYVHFNDRFTVNLKRNQKLFLQRFASVGTDYAIS